MGNETLLDRDHLDTQTFGDAALAQDLIGLVREQCQRLLPGIGDTGLAARDRADLAHTLKGSALGVGAARVAARAGEVEQALRTACLEAPARVGALAGAVQATLRAIDDHG